MHEPDPPAGDGGGRRWGRVGLSRSLPSGPRDTTLALPGSWSGGGGEKMQLPQQRPGDRVSGGAPRESSHDRLSILQAEVLRARVSALAQPRAKPGPETGRTRHPETPPPRQCLHVGKESQPGGGAGPLRVPLQAGRNPACALWEPGKDKRAALLFKGGCADGGLLPIPGVPRAREQGLAAAGTPHVH